MSLKSVVPKMFHIFINTCIYPVRSRIPSFHRGLFFLTAESDNLSTIRDSTSLNGGVGRGQRSCDREGEPLLGWQDEPIMTMEWDTKWNTVAIGGIYRTDRRTVVKLSGGGIPAKLLVFGQSRLNSLAAHSAPLNEISIGLFRDRMRVGNFILGQIIFCSIS